MAERPLHVASVNALTLRDFEAYGAEWLADCELRQHSRTTLEARRNLLDRVLWLAREQEWAECGTREIRAFLLYLTRGHETTPGGRWGNPRLTQPAKPGTVETYFINLQTFCNWLVEEGALPASPMAKLKPPVNRPDQITPFTAEQVEGLKAAARRSGNPRRNELIVMLLLDTGARVSELCALTWRDVDLPGRRLVVMGKGQKRRSLFFGVKATRALWAYRREKERHGAGLAEESPVFTSDAGTTPGAALTRWGVAQLIQRLGTAAGVEAVRCSPHTFRHTFAVQFLMQGGNVFALQQLLGHTSLTICQRYVALAQADLASQHAKFSPGDRMKKAR
jgi:integrase/recombinase XerC